MVIRDTAVEVRLHVYERGPPALHRTRPGFLRDAVHIAAPILSGCNAANRPAHRCGGGPLDCEPDSRDFFESRVFVRWTPQARSGGELHDSGRRTLAYTNLRQSVQHTG